MKRSKIFFLAILLGLSGCITTKTPEPKYPYRYSPSKIVQSERLMDRPDFRTAALAAPDWVDDALDTINQLEKALLLEKNR